MTECEYEDLEQLYTASNNTKKVLQNGTFICWSSTCVDNLQEALSLMVGGFLFPGKNSVLIKKGLHVWLAFQAKLERCIDEIGSICCAV